MLTDTPQNPTTAQHTPGPWRDGKPFDAIVSDNPQGITPYNKTWDNYGGHLVAESVAPCNKALIKAAPDLLAALKAINEWSATEAGYQALPFEPPWAAQMYAAISRAEGRQP